jgi:hypothetical protein
VVLKVAWCCAIAKTNKAPFRNVCFYGPPGTGKVRHLAMPGPQTLRGMQVTSAVWRTQCEHRRASDARTIDYSTAAS